MQGVGEDDDGIAGPDEAALAQEGEGGADIGLRIVFLKGHLNGLHTAGQRENAADVQVRGEGEDGRELGPLVGEQVGHDTAQGESDQLGTGDGVGEHDGGFGGFMLVRFQRGIGGKAAGGIAGLNAAGHGVQHLHAFVRVTPDAGLAAEHDAVHLLDDSVEDVGDFGAGGHGVFDHALQHLGGDDDLAAVVGAALDDVALNDGEILHGQLGAEVAAGDHDASGGFDDGVEVVERLLVFDLGDDAGIAAFLLEQKLDVLDVARFTGKGEGHEIDAKLDAEIEVLVVLGGERRQTDGHAGEIDVAAGAHLALGEDFTDDAAVADAEHAQLDEAAIDVDEVAGLEVHAQFGVIDIDGVRHARRETGLGAEFDVVARLELPGAFEVAGTDGGAGEVHEDGHILAGALGGLADIGINGARPIVGGVAHVEPDDVGAGADEGLNVFGRLRGRPEGDEDFGFARAGHERGRFRTSGFGFFQV